MSALAATQSIYSRWDSAHWHVASIFNPSLHYSFSSPNDISQQVSALNGLYARAYFMLGISETLSSRTYNKATSSSDSDVASIRAYEEGAVGSLGATGEVFQLQAYQTAQNQVNQGDVLDPEAAAAMGAGSHTFTLTVGGTGHNLSVTINAADTNDTALNKIAQAINAAGAGVTANLVRDTGSVYLSLYGASGLNNAFSLADTAGTALNATGANTAVQTARNAEYLLNGAPYVEESNRLSLLDGQLEVELEGTGQATVTAEGNQLATELGHFLGAMNGFSDYLGASTYLATDLQRAWAGLVTGAATQLSRYGLEGNPDLQLGLDLSTFNTAWEKEPAQVQDAITAEGGLANTVSAFMAKILSAPGAALLQTVPYLEEDPTYFTSQKSAPWFRVAAAGFSQVV